MGEFFESYQIKNNDSDDVRKALDSISVEPFPYILTPSINNWVSLYTEEFDERIPLELSRSLDTLILGVMVHDGDVFFNLVYHRGKEIDQFCSCPDYFEPVSEEEKERQKGQPELWANLLPHAVSSESIKEVFDSMRSVNGEYAFPRLEEFSKLLSLPNTTTSFTYLTEDGCSDWGLQRLDEFVRVP